MSSIPIPIRQVQSVDENVAELREKITKIAYDRFLNRGEAPGNDLDDWLSAEADLVVKSRADSRIEDNHIVVEIVVRDIDPSMLLVNITPHEVLVLSAPDENGRRVFQSVRFQREIEPVGIEAEYVVDTLFIVAGLREDADWNRAAAHVA